MRIGEHTLNTFLFLWFIMICVYACDAHCAEKDATVLLARSCVGEAGWGSTSDDAAECAALGHRYLKLSGRGHYTFPEIIQKYSAPMKPRPDHPAKWLLHMNPACDKPKHWPRNLRWKNYIPSCRQAFDFATRFVAGEIPDPLPIADHFGDINDAKRAIKAGWIRVDAPDHYRNLFWCVPKGKENECSG